MELLKYLFEIWGAVFKTVLTSPSIIILFILCILIKIYYPKIRGFMGEFIGCSNYPKCRFIKK